MVSCCILGCPSRTERKTPNITFFTYISRAVCESSDDDAAKSSSKSFCVLPSQPKNGRYEILEPEVPGLSPGTQLGNFTIQVTCDPGFHLPASPIVLCLDGSYSQDTECLPYCTKPRDNVMSSGLEVHGEESRCIIPDQILESHIMPMEKELECGSTGPEFANLIVGGRLAKKQKVPWHAGIYTKQTQPYMQICGGTLVSETVVISAASCFWTDVDKQLPASNYAVAVGKLYRPWSDPHDENAQKSDVVEIRIPPRFHGDATQLQDDIALVVVAAPFRFTASVTPVCLDFDLTFNNRQLAAGNMGEVAGWGLTSEDGRESPVLKVVELPVVSIEECFELSDPTFRSHITSDKFCAGHQNGTSVCKGDSGGGLSFPEAVRGVKRYFLRGVLSAAPRSNHLCNTLTWATFTHVQKHEVFIRETIPNTSSLPATVE